ncbi:MAG: rhamnulose-1-phosphate aldolase [Fusobacteriaceae bacterium]
MRIEDTKILKAYTKVTHDSWKKGWHERNGGNFSYRMTPDEVKEVSSFLKPTGTKVDLNFKVENLANEYFIVTGSGKFLRNVEVCAEENIGILKVASDGKTYEILWGLVNGAKPTSELPTHLMNHAIKVKTTNGKERAILHSHTPNIIALTFVLPLDGQVFTKELWEMMSECALVFPNGIGIVPWMVPGGNEIGEATSKLMENNDAVVWAHHGIFCSGETLDLTFGLLDTIEKAAEILVKVISMGGKKQSITKQNMFDLAKAFKMKISEKIFK